MRFTLFSLAIGLSIQVGLAEDDPAEKPEGEGKDPAPKVAKIGEHLYRLGEIEFNAKTREVTVPVVVNMREGGPIEYILVHEAGKVHEAILTTKASPLDLQIAMKLVKYKTGHGDVFNRLLAPEILEKEGGEKEDRGDSIDAVFEPEDGETIPAYELIIDGATAEAMTPGGWVYTGSVMENGSFMAESEGSIIAIYLDHLAMFNMTREGSDLDERWGARTSAIPEIGTKGTLRISLRDSGVTD